MQMPSDGSQTALKSRLIVALDTADLEQARDWAEALAPHCGVFKVGLQFFLTNGPDGLRSITGRPIFLDLKVHDIPSTVAGAVCAAMAFNPMMLSLHACGGAAMIEAARESAERAGDKRPLLLAVTVLTSLDGEMLAAQGIADQPTQQALRLGRLAMAAGADGLVCGAQEIVPLRDALGARPKLVVPGIRSSGVRADDQKRTATPEAAIAAGADWIVVGRQITSSSNPAVAAAAIWLK